MYNDETCRDRELFLQVYPRQQAASASHRTVMIHIIYLESIYLEHFSPRASCAAAVSDSSSAPSWCLGCTLYACALHTCMLPLPPQALLKQMCIPALHHCVTLLSRLLRASVAPSRLQAFSPAPRTLPASPCLPPGPLSG